MYYSFDNIIIELKKNKSITLPKTLPLCPKQNDISCKKDVGHCLTGNVQKCEQRFQIETEKGLFILYPKFVYPVNTKQGVIEKYNSTLNLLFNKGIINEQNLEEL